MHPTEHAEVIELSEEGLGHLYEYESKTLSPGIQHPSGKPPMR